MNMKFIVEISSNKEDPQKLDIEIHRPAKISKKWGGLALLTHMGILKGLQEAYKVANGQLQDENKDK